LPQQFPEVPRRLEVAQAWRVRRADVEDEVSRERCEQLDAATVVLRGALERRHTALPDVDSQNRLDSLSCEAPRDLVGARVGEAHPVAGRAAGGETEDSRARVSRLGDRRDGTDLDEPEAERPQPIERGPALVESRREPDRIREVDVPESRT